MSHETFDVFLRAPVWVLCLAFLAGLLLALEVGYRVGKHNRHREGSDIGPIQGAVLGLLGLLLAFTYSYVATRVDNRKQAVVEEANAIGTAYLRAGLMPEPGRDDLRNLLRAYTDLRIVTAQIASDPARLQANIAESEALHNQLWATAAKLLDARAPTPIDGLMFQSLNEVIDMHGRRLAAGRDRLPGLILALLFIVAIVALAVTGFITGHTGQRNSLLTVTLAVMLTAVTYIIIDLDHSRSGIIRVSQESLQDLQKSLRIDAVDNRSDAEKR